MPENQSPTKEGTPKKRRGLRILKRFFLLIIVLLVICIGALFAIPYFFKDQLLTSVKEATNSQLNATVDFEDASLTFFKDFPKLTLALDNYSVANKAPFEGLTLIEGKVFSLSFDLMSVIKTDRPLEIHAVELVEPTIQIVVLEDGSANYDITIPADSIAVDTVATASSGGIEIELDKYAIAGGNIIYDDRSQDIYVETTNLNHSGKGRFTADVYDLDTETEIDALTLEMAGTDYFKKTNVEMVMGLLINTTDQQYTLKENSLRLNALQLEAAGFVSIPDEETIDLDLSLKAPGNDFKELLSLIPNAFIEGFEDVKASGNFNLDAKITGSLKGENYPQIDLKLDIDKGQFQYPDLPLGISDIQTNIKVGKAQGNLDLLKVLIPDFQLRIGGELLAGHFNLTHPISDPDLDTRVTGQLDLRDLLDAFPMEGVNTLAGTLTADISAKARLSQLTNEAYEDVDVAGTLDLQGIKYVADGLPAVDLNQAGLNFSPHEIKIRKFNAQIGNSDIELEGELKNFLAYFSPTEAVTGRMYLRADKLDLNELAGSDSSSSIEVNEQSAPSSQEAPFDRFDFDFDAAAGQILFDNYDLRNCVVKGRVSANRSELEKFAMEFGESDLKADGYVTNTWDYLFEDGVLGGSINLYSNYFDLNPFMVVSEETAAAGGGEAGSAGAVMVPDNIDLAINANMKKILYTDIEIEDLVGTLRIANETVSIEDCQTKILGGKIGLAGAYDTQDAANPYFNFKYDIDKFDFQKAFNTFNTFQTLAPVGKYINGNFNSTLIMEGTLKEDMTPDYSRLSADGFLETFNATVQGFPPLQKLGNQLNVDFLNNLDISDTKNWFTFANGMVDLKDFDISKDGVDMTIGGTHSITQEINYNVLAKVPREKLTNNALGNAADSGLDLLRSQASQLGVSIEESEFVNLDIQLTGTMTNPKINVKLLGTDGEKTLAESAKAEAKDLLDAEKAKLEAEAKARLDAEKAKLAAEADKLKEEAANKAKEKVAEATDAAKKELEKKAGEEVGKVTDKLEENLGEEAKKGADKIKEELENFNPFKKKKKGN